MWPTVLEAVVKFSKNRLVLSSSGSNEVFTPCTLEVLRAGGTLTVGMTANKCRLGPLLSTVTVILALKLITRDL